VADTATAAAQAGPVEGCYERIVDALARRIKLRGRLIVVIRKVQTIAAPHTAPERFMNIVFAAPPPVPDPPGAGPAGQGQEGSAVAGGARNQAGPGIRPSGSRRREVDRRPG
jgi:hypothetical protein